MEADRKSQGKIKLALTQREFELVAAAWLSTSNPPIDWDKFADLAGFKNAHSARTCFGPIKKKLHEQFGNGPNSSPGGGVVKTYQWKPRAPRKKQPQQPQQQQQEAGSSPVIPTTTGDGGGVGADAEDAEGEIDDLGGGGGPSPAKRARTMASSAPAVAVGPGAVDVSFEDGLV